MTLNNKTKANSQTVLMPILQLCEQILNITTIQLVYYYDAL